MLLSLNRASIWNLEISHTLPLHLPPDHNHVCMPGECPSFLLSVAPSCVLQILISSKPKLLDEKSWYQPDNNSFSMKCKSVKYFMKSGGSTVKQKQILELWKWLKKIGLSCTFSSCWVYLNKTLVFYLRKISQV